MQYAVRVGSRRSTSRLQRQASNKETSSQFSVTTTPTHHDRPSNNVTVATTSIKSNTHTNDTNRLQHLRDTFMLDDNDLQDIHQAFCYMAKTKLSQSTTAAKSKQIKKKKNRRQKSWEIPDDTVTLSLSDFFATFQPSQRTNNGGYFDAIFHLIGTKDLHAMTYIEFVEGICTFCTFKLDDLIRFVFFILDKEKSGLIPRFQLLRFVESIHGGKKIQVFEKAIMPPSTNDIADANDIPSVSSLSPQKNFTTNTNIHLPTAERQQSSVNYQQLKQLCIDYPTLLEPMLLFQSKLRRRIKGEVWWKKKESMIIKEQHRILTLEKKEGTNDEESKQKGIKKMKISIGGLFRRVLSFDVRRRKKCWS